MSATKDKVRLNLGCGITLIGDGWINVDNSFDLQDLIDGSKHKKGIFKDAVIPDFPKDIVFVRGDILKLPFKDEYSDEVMLDNVLEHLSIQDVIPALKEIRRVMKTGSKMRIIVPSFDGLLREYFKMRCKVFNVQEYLKVLYYFMGIQVTEGEYHRCHFSPEFLTFVLNQAGFVKGTIHISEQGIFPTPELMPIVPRYLKKGKMLGTPIIDYLVANVIK